MEVTFSLKENPWPLDFVTKANLRDFGLASTEGRQVAFVASPTATMPPHTDDASLETAVGPAGRLSVV